MTGCNTSYGQQVIRDTVLLNETDLEEPIVYSARDSIYSDFVAETVELYGDAKVSNGGIIMNAGYILIDLNNSEVTAKYIFDEDSNRIEMPKFTDGADEILATTIRYNFDTEKGFIEELSIKQDENFLYMGVAKRHENDEIHFLKGRFTTCDLEDPHYHFQLSKAVMIPDERIVSGPMNLWVKGVPTPLGLPFSIIPQMEEKNQGLMFPNFVPISNFGFGIQDLGYYWPINDNVQTTLYASIYSRGSWGVRNVMDYAKRYGYTGSLLAGFQQFKSGFPDNINQNKMTLKWQHRVDPKSSPLWGFSANVNFISDNNSQSNLDPLNSEYFNNTLTSDINLSRKFPGKPVTMGMKTSLRQNSQTKNISLTSPVVNINVTRFFPFKNLFRSSKGGFAELFGRLGITYNFEGQNRALFEDTLLRDGNFSEIGSTYFNGIKQDVTIQTTAGLFKNTWKVTPSLNYGNRTNFQQTRKKFENGTVIVDTLSQLGTGNSLSANIQLTTALYTYYKFIGKKKPILRHVLTPSFTYKYIPNLTPVFYYHTDTDSVAYSPFETSLYNLGSVNDQSLLTFNFNNTFEIKTINEKDTVDGFKRTRIVDVLSFNGYYNFMNDSMPLSDIKVNLRISPTKWMNFVATSNFSPYAWDDTTGATLPQFAIDTFNTLGRFTRSNFATTFTFTSKSSRKKLNNKSNNIETNWNDDFNYYLLHPEHAIDFTIPWKLSLSHVYTLSLNQSVSETNPDRINQIQTLMLNGDLSFSKRWKLIAVTNFDINQLIVTNTRFTLTRDMHCWALAFHWTPIGTNQSFLFSLRSTSQLFSDAKIDIRKPPSFL